MLDKLIQFIHDISDWLEALGFIVGLVTVIKVFFLNKKVKELQGKHLFQVRVKEHISDLKCSSKAISNYLTNFQANPKGIKHEVSQCIEHCNSIRKKVSTSDLANLKPLITKMKKMRDNKIDSDLSPTFFQKLFKRVPITENDIDEVYTQLNSLITEIEHFKNDLKRTIQ